MASKPKIYLTRKIFKEAYEMMKSKGYEIRSWNSDTTVPRDVLLKEVEAADALYCVALDKIDEELLERGKNLRVIATMSVGYDHIDVQACRRRQIKLGYTPDVLTEACAELGIGLILCTTRRLIEANQHVMTGKWETWYPTYLCGRGILESTVGIIGLGRIGLSIAEKLKSFHPKEILYHNRKPSEKGDGLGAKFTSLDDLLRQSDFVISCCPLSKETEKFFNRDRFSLMKPTAQFFNLSRGGVVDQDALYEALSEKKILAAGLDVSSPEPLPVEHKLLKLDNFIMLPHISSATIETRIRMATLAASNVIAGVENQKLPAEIP